MRFGVLLFSSIAAIVGCSERRTIVGAGETHTPTSDVPIVAQGLTQKEIDMLYHLPLGGEKIPYSWVMALTDPLTGAPFMENPAR